MSVSGADVSVYQAPDRLDGWDFAILNHEDPHFSAKLDRVVALGIPYAMYAWLYPGQGRESLTRMKAHDDLLALNGDQRPTFYWLDYEQSGVVPGDLRDGLQAAVDEKVAVKTGAYSYLAVIGSVIDVIHEFGAPLWLAYYPDPNDGSYPDGQDHDANHWGAVLWQYSSGGNLDRNRVIDEAWYLTHHGKPPGAPPPPLPKGAKPMILHDTQIDQWYLLVAGGCMPIDKPMAFTLATSGAVVVDNLASLTILGLGLGAAKVLQAALALKFPPA